MRETKSRKISCKVSACIPLFALVTSVLSLMAQSSSMLGNWREPGGSVLHIDRCSSGICLRITSLSPGAPAVVDSHNPNASLRSRSLCNLEIGSHFQLNDATHASGGMLYDPKSGNTYHGTMTVEGDVLKLRGYVGFPIFGRTETWRRDLGTIPPCGSQIH